MQSNDDSSDNLAPPDLRIRYSNFEHLGAGGMGIVLGAHDEHLNRAVAIKLLPRNSDNAIAVMRFQQEAKAVSKLNNQHVVQVLDFGYTAGGEPYLVMERVTGESLEEILERDGSFSIQFALEIATQLSVALEHAHANEVVHRDLKPGNVMIDKARNVKVLDFGLARILSLDELDWRLTRPGQPLGSLLYMSPEQTRGEEADARSDVFSLGLIIIKMVSGVLPWEGLTAIEIVRSRLEEQPAALPVGDDRTLSSALNKVVQKAVQLEPDKRYANMSDLRADLLDVASDPQRFLDGTSMKTGEAKRTSSLLMIGCALLLLIGLSTIVLTVGKTEKGRGHHRDQPSVSGESFKATRDRVIKEKFRVKGDPAHPVWYAEKTATDKDVAMLSGLRIVDISFEGNHQITAGAIESMSRLPLEQLSVRDTNIGDDSIKHINKLRNLTYLDFQESLLSDDGVEQLSSELPLKHLDVKTLRGLTNKGLRFIIKTYPKLDFLSISNSHVSGEGVRLLPALQDLTVLRVSGLELNDDDVVNLSRIRLGSLDISNNPITDRTLDMVRKISTLSSVDLEMCPGVSSQALEKLRKDLPRAKIKPSPKAVVKNSTKGEYNINMLYSEEFDHKLEQ